MLLSAQGMDVAQISKVAFTSPDRLLAVLHNFNDDGFDSWGTQILGRTTTEASPCPSAGRSKKIASSAARWTTTCPFRPGACPSSPSSWWPRGWSTTSATRAGRAWYSEKEGVAFQVIKTYKVKDDFGESSSSTHCTKGKEGATEGWALTNATII